MHFRQKQPVVEAKQWFPPENPKHEQLVEVAVEFPEVLSGDGSFWPAYAVVRRPAGALFLYPGDWLVTDCSGNMSVVPGSVFGQQYEAA